MPALPRDAENGLLMLLSSPVQEDALSTGQGAWHRIPVRRVTVKGTSKDAREVILPEGPTSTENKHKLLSRICCMKEGPLSKWDRRQQAQGMP